MRVRPAGGSAGGSSRLDESEHSRSYGLLRANIVVGDKRETTTLPPVRPISAQDKFFVWGPAARILGFLLGRDILRGFFQHAVCRPPGSHGPGRGLPGFLRTWSRCTCPPRARVPPSGGTSRAPNAASPSGWQGGGAEGPWRPRGTGGGGRGGVCGCLRSRNVLEIRPRPTSPPPDRANAPFILLKETHLPVARCEREVGP